MDETKDIETIEDKAIADWLKEKGNNGKKEIKILSSIGIPTSEEEAGEAGEIRILNLPKVREKQAA